MHYNSQFLPTIWENCLCKSNWAHWEAWFKVWVRSVALTNPKLWPHVKIALLTFSSNIGWKLCSIWGLIRPNVDECWSNMANNQVPFRACLALQVIRELELTTNSNLLYQGAGLIVWSHLHLTHYQLHGIMPLVTTILICSQNYQLGVSDFTDIWISRISITYWFHGYQISRIFGYHGFPRRN